MNDGDQQLYKALASLDFNNVEDQEQFVKTVNN